ncbi:hypothetical protein FA95DRAFT_1345655 [Auriscalpium vulgare]|uniref:Uncharacterized protein n=1 Tax=Auriscalpium vulgare TaxID=40419 RepID=A0ACB8RSC0_9AGAM|nr:hypothetical protein FA95DRAFT_1345655 [Auriscalpium vulgare]
MLTTIANERTSWIGFITTTCPSCIESQTRPCCSICMGGRWLRPRSVRARCDGEGGGEAPGKPFSRPFSPAFTPQNCASRVSTVGDRSRWRAYDEASILDSLLAHLSVGSSRRCNAPFHDDTQSPRAVWACYIIQGWMSFVVFGIRDTAYTRRPIS